MGSRVSKLTFGNVCNACCGWAKTGIHSCKSSVASWRIAVWSKDTPPSGVGPRGGFLFTMFPHQKPCVRRPPSKNLEQILRGRSSCTRFLMREHSNRNPPRGGGGSFDQIAVARRLSRMCKCCSVLRMLQCIAYVAVCCTSRKCFSKVTLQHMCIIHIFLNMCIIHIFLNMFVCV